MPKKKATGRTTPARKKATGAAPSPSSKKLAPLKSTPKRSPASKGGKKGKQPKAVAKLTPEEEEAETLALKLKAAEWEAEQALQKQKASASASLAHGAARTDRLKPLQKAPAGSAAAALPKTRSNRRDGAALSPSKLLLYVNGQRRLAVPTDAHVTMAPYLRNELGLTGTKDCGGGGGGGGSGGCRGACCVVLSRVNLTTGGLEHVAVASCALPLAAADGCAITTVEGLGGRGGDPRQLHPLQQSFADGQAIQCGFCTPGQLMSCAALQQSVADSGAGRRPSHRELEAALAGNSCRCAPYRAVVEAARSAMCDSEGGPARSTVPGFPAELNELNPRKLRLVSDHGVLVAPTSLRDLLDQKSKDPKMVLVAGGLAAREKLERAAVDAILTRNVPELRSLEREGGTLVIGAAVELATVRLAADALADEGALQRGFESHHTPLRALADAIDGLTAVSPQLSSAATLGGSLCSAEPSSNFIPLFCALGSRLRIARLADGQVSFREMMCTVDMCHEAWLMPDEVIVSVLFEVNLPGGSLVQWLKPACQASYDAASLCAVFLVMLDETGKRAKAAKLVFGGVEDVCFEAPLAAAKLCAGSDPTAALGDAMDAMSEDLAPYLTGAPKAAYRETLAASLLFRFGAATGFIDDASAAEGLTRRSLVQAVELVAATPSVPRCDARGLLTGRTEFAADDATAPKRCLYAAFVLSSAPHAKLKNVNVTAAFELPGVHDWIDDSDSSQPGLVFAWDRGMRSGTVAFVGEPIGLVLAESAEVARQAARLVTVEYEALPAILSMADAEAMSSTIPLGDDDSCGFVERGDADGALADAVRVIDGEICIGGSEHFYAETWTFAATPSAQLDEVTLEIGGQTPHANQQLISQATGLPSSAVNVVARRPGGAFGGKGRSMSQCAAALCISSLKTGQPCRAALSREEDMQLSGKSEGLKVAYKMGLSEPRWSEIDWQWAPSVTVLQLSVTANCGVEADAEVLLAGLLNGPLTYSVPNVRLSLTALRTNLPPSAPIAGRTQAAVALAVEMAVEHASRSIFPLQDGLDDRCVFRTHMLTLPSSLTPTGQTYGDSQAVECWKTVLLDARVALRVEDVLSYNAKNRWKKRGLACIPTVFGVTDMCAGSALVVVSADGSVKVHHGGVDSGGGTQTLLAQVAARALGTELTQISVAVTRTGVTANADTSAASDGTDTSCNAVVSACEQLLLRLAPIKVQLLEASDSVQEPTLAELAAAATAAGVDLSANSFQPPAHSVAGIKWDKGAVSGWEVSRICFGAAVSEVELDVLTGDRTVLRADLICDAGASLNPAADAAQLQSGFMQGVGYFLKEELLWCGAASPSPGKLRTVGGGSYRIPALGDVPARFNIKLLTNNQTSGVLSGKAEAGIAMGSSVYFALRDAVAAARRDAGCEAAEAACFRLDCPATPERVRLACADPFVCGSADVCI